MAYTDFMSEVTVIGAAGKMGRGIALLLTQELLRLTLRGEAKAGRLNLVDANRDALRGLRDYLAAQLHKDAERACVSLRKSYATRADLVENADIIEQYVADGLALLDFGTELGLAKRSSAVFEAILEDESVKVSLYSSLREQCGPDTVFLTNTSSIPIGVIDRAAKLDGRLIGCHFYNPPPVQKLVEVIAAPNTKPELAAFVRELGKRLGKKLVESNDIAGFIGNGHFLRDGLFGLAMAERLTSELTLPGALYAVNKVTQDLLIRPMGILQLIDYVGIDVFDCIARTMAKHLGESFASPLVTRLLEAKVKGGQQSDGTQKNGLLQYERGKPVAVYDLEKRAYVRFNDGDFAKKLDAQLGAYPEGHLSWKAAVADKAVAPKLAAYFTSLAASPARGAKLAREYAASSKAIGQKLVQAGVAKSKEDVNDVLTNGFYHAYGPINDYV